MYGATDTWQAARRFGSTRPDVPLCASDVGSSMKTPRMPRAGGLAASGLLAWPALLLTQEGATGLVGDGATGAPLPGAVVTTRDSAGRVRRQVLTDATGRFAILADPVWPRLRVVRAGCIPVRGEGRAWHASSGLDLQMTPFEFELPTTTVKARPVCRGNEALAKTTASGAS